MKILGREITTNQDREELLVTEYLRDLDEVKAAIRAGYPADEALIAAKRILKKPENRERIRLAINARMERTTVDTDWFLKRLATCVDRCMASIPVIDQDGKPTGVYKWDASNALRGLELAAKHLGILKPETLNVNIQNLPPDIQIILVEPTAPIATPLPNSTAPLPNSTAPLPPPLRDGETFIDAEYTTTPEITLW